MLQGIHPINQRAGTLPFQQMGISVEGKGTMYSIYFNYKCGDLESQLESCPFLSELVTNQRLYHPECALQRISFQEKYTFAKGRTYFVWQVKNQRKEPKYSLKKYPRLHSSTETALKRQMGGNISTTQIYYGRIDRILKASVFLNVSVFQVFEVF